MSNLGHLYRNGLGVPRSHERAVELFKQSAAQGNPQAECNLANCFEFGNGIAQNYKEARRLYAKSAKHGVPEAIERLKRVDEKIRADIIRKMSPLVGKRVVVTGTSREDLNGRAGLALAFDGSKGRYVVKLDEEGEDEAGPAIKVKPGNLKAAA